MNRHRKSPVNNGQGKMSPQAAVGYRNWPDEDGHQTKHGRGKHVPKHTPKTKTLRTHRPTRH